MRPRKAEWLHLFNELLEKDFPTAAAGLWLDVLTQKLYWVDPPEKPLSSPESAEALTKDVEQALGAASEFLGQAAAKISRIALDREADNWSVGQTALKQICKGCIDVIRTRRGLCPGERAKALAEALGDPNCVVIKNDLTEAEFAQFLHDLAGAKKV
jgi:hypothetical protein